MGSPVITGPIALEDAWPAVADVVAAMLRRRGVDPWLVDDLVQETAVRVLAREAGYETTGDLRRFACVVAWRLAIDDSRAARHRNATLVDEHACATDVAREVETRETLAAVARGFRQLSPADQAALLTTEVVPADRRTSVRLAVRRHRARTRLLALVEVSLALFAALLRRVTSVARRRWPVTVAADVAASVSLAVFVSVAAGTQPARLDRVRAAPFTPPVSAIAPEPLAEVGRAASNGLDGPASSGSRAVRAGWRSAAGQVEGHVRVPGPSGTVDATVRPKASDDHLVCGDTIVLGWQCHDVPALPVAPVG